MQDLFKTGVAFLAIQAATCLVLFLLGDAGKALFAAAIAMAIVMVGLFAQRGMSARLEMAVALSYAFGAMALDGFLSLATGVGGTLLLVAGLVFTGFRATEVGMLLSKRRDRPERFIDGFMGALPLGIGIIYAFAVMWERAAKPRPPAE